MTQKQVFDIRPGKGFSQAQSNEHQRRWSEKAWQHATAKGNYDRSRVHLNFEIVAGCKVQSVDTSRSIPRRISDTIRERGIRDRNEGLAEPKYRTVANIVFSGNAERMYELGFGKQIVDYEKDADNSKIVRQPDIEEWAKDIYQWACGKWGEENIVQFICHMDEKTPHIHCTVLPVDHRNQLSFRNVFAGEDKMEFSRRISELHSSLAAVNAKWGLARGTGSTGPHVPNEVYRKRLKEENESLTASNASLKERHASLTFQIRQAEKRVKALTTMVANAQRDRDRLKTEIDGLMKTAKSSGAERDRILQQIAAKRNELSLVENRLADKSAKLADASTTLEVLSRQTSASQKRLERLQAQIKEVDKSVLEIAKGSVAIASMETMANEFKHSLSSLVQTGNDHIFDDSLLKDMAERGNQILVCAWMLFSGYVTEATEFARTNGGGGESTSLPWGRKPDEDDRQWAYRCLNQARKLMRSPHKRVLHR